MSIRSAAHPNSPCCSAAGCRCWGSRLWAPFVGAANYYDYLGTIGTLGLILVYMGVTGAVLAVLADSQAPALGAAGGARDRGAHLAALQTAFIPWPAYPNNLWPYAVLAWIVIGMALLVGRPTFVAGEGCRRIARPLPNL